MRTRSLTAFVFFLLAGSISAWAQPYAYVSGSAADAVGVVDLQTNTLVGTFPLAGLPSGLALGPNGLLFVSRSRLDSVARIDPSTGATTSIAVGTGPAGLAAGVGRNPEPAGRHLPRIFVANGASDSVSVIDPLAGTVLATLPVGDVPLDLVTRGSRLYVANWAEGTVSVIDTLALSVVATVTVGRQPAGLAVHSQTGRVYVANFFDDTVSVVDPTSLSVVATIPVARRPRGLALDPVAGRLYVAGFEDGVIEVIDTATHAVLIEASSVSDNPVDLLLTPDRQRLYVAHLAAGESVRVLDATTLAPLAALAAPEGPVALAGFTREPPALARMPGRLRGALEEIGSRWTSAPPMPSPGRDTAPAAEGTAVSFSDGTFAPADWQVLSSMGFQTTTQQAAGGNPGFWRRTVHPGGPTTLATVHRLVDPQRQYDPAQQGAIDSVDASWDYIHLTAGFTRQAFVLVQDGVAYATAPAQFAFNFWQTIRWRGLRDSDFDDGLGGHPDFSTAGGVISFGYSRASDATDGTVSHGLDNFAVTVHSGVANLPGNVSFRLATDFVSDGAPSITVLVDRVGGTLGAIGATVLYRSPEGTNLTFELQWPDGVGAPRTIALLPNLPATNTHVGTGRLNISSVTGGAAIGARPAMTVFVYSESWELAPLALGLLLLLAGTGPGFLALLAVPTVLLAVARTRRARRLVGPTLVLAMLLSLSATAGATDRGRARLDGVELEYSVQGTGEPVVFIHNGVGVDWFAPLVRQPALARYRLVTYHRVGYAGSSPSSGATSFAQEAGQARALMRHLGVESAHLVGHSSSALIALQLALDVPEAVRSVALLEPALLAVPSPAQVGRSVELYRAGDKRQAVDVFLQGTCGSDYRVALDRALPGAFEQAVAGADRFFGQELPALRQTSFGPAQAERITQPILAVVGAASGPIHRQRWELLRQWLPDSEAFTLPAAGHLLYVENPAAMAQGLADFFARHPLRGAPGRPAPR